MWVIGVLSRILIPSPDIYIHDNSVHSGLTKGYLFWTQKTVLDHQFQDIIGYFHFHFVTHAKNRTASIL